MYKETLLLCSMSFCLYYTGSHIVETYELRLNYHYITTLSYGRLEVYYSNQWIPFSITGFDMFAADLACKSLGYGFASRYARVGYLGYIYSILDIFT